MFNKYNNNLGWCNYPFTNEPLGYCWSYANFVDGNLVCHSVKVDNKDKLKLFCNGCDCFKKEE